MCEKSNDVRLYCSEAQKKRIKMYSVQKGISISEVLQRAMEQTYPELMSEENEIREENGYGRD